MFLLDPSFQPSARHVTDGRMSRQAPHLRESREPAAGAARAPSTAVGCVEEPTSLPGARPAAAPGDGTAL